MKTLRMLSVIASVCAATAVLASQGPPRESREDSAAAELSRLERLVKQPGASPETLWDGLLALRLAYPGTQAARRAGQLLLRARSPLDRLDPKEVPAEESFAWQPPGLVAVLGEHRARHWGSLTRLQFSRNGKFVVSSSGGDGVRIWDAASMRLLLWHKAGWAFALSPDGKQLAIGEGIGVIRVYDLDGEARLRERLVLRKPRHYIEGITFAPGGKGLAVKYREETDLKAPAVPRPITDVYVLWDWSKGKPTQEELPRRDSEWRPLLTPDGKVLIHYSRGSKLSLWNVGREAAGLRAELEQISSFALSPDGKTLAAKRVGSEEHITLWDITAVPPKELTNFDGRRVDLKGFSPDGRLLTWSDSVKGGRLLLWPVGDLVRHGQGKGQLPTPREVKLPFRASLVAFASDGRRIAFGTRDGSVRLWDLVKGRELFPPAAAYPNAGPVAFSPDGRTLAIVGHDFLRLWDMGGPRPRETFARRLDEDEAPREIAFAPAGGLLAFRTWRGEVRLWDLQGKAPRQVASRPRHKEDKLGCLAFDPGEEGLVLLGAREVDPKQGKWQTSLLACKVDAGRGKIVEGQWFPGGEVQDDSSLAWPDAVVVSPSGRHLAFATSLDVHIWEWHGARRQQWAVLGGLGKRVNGAAFSPDGLELATCGSDYVDDGKNTGDWVERVWLWDLTGAQPRPRRGFDVSDVYRLDYALGGDALMVQEGRACVLRDKKTGKQLWRWQPPGGGTFAVVAPDRRHVALTNSNGTIYIVRLKEPDKP